MSIVAFDGLPSWSLDTSETGESTKCPWVGVVEDTVGGNHPNAFNLTATTHGHFVVFPVSLASRDQDGGPSNSTINIYDLTEK